MESRTAWSPEQHGLFSEPPNRGVAHDALPEHVTATAEQLETQASQDALQVQWWKSSEPSASYSKMPQIGLAALGFALAAPVVATGLVACQLVMSGSNEAEIVRTKLLVVQFVSGLTYSLPILDSYGLCHAIRMDAAFSGEMLGIYSFTTIIGAGIVWILSMLYPMLWRGSGWKIIVLGLSCNIVSMCVYMAVVMGASSHKGDHSRLPHYLLCARILGGLGQGMIAQLGSTTIVRVTPAPERPLQMVNFMAANMASWGLGPLLAVTVRSVKPTWIGPAYLNLTLLSAVLLWLPFRLPSLAEIPDMTAVDPGNPQGPQDPLAQDPLALLKRRLVLAGCLTMGMLRGYSISGIDVSAALLLEVTFMWPLGTTGLLISTVMLLAIPVSLIYKMHKDRMSLAAWIRMLCTICLLGNFLVLASHDYGGWVLLLADALAFPTIFVADALGVGIMQKNLLPAGSLFADANSSQMWRICLTNSGRFFGPWFARWFIQHGGTTPYAFSQIMITLAFVLVFEVLVNPNANDTKETVEHGPSK